MSVHILVECLELLPSVRLGVLEPLSPLEAQGTCEVRFCMSKDINRGDIAWSDVVICVRGCELPSWEIATCAKRSGRKLIYFLDDDLLHVPAQTGSETYFGNAQIQENIKKILSISDALWVVNPRVGRNYSTYCSKWFLSKVPVRTCAQFGGRENERLHILYAGSTDHQSIVRNLLVPALHQLNQDVPGQFDVTFIGPNPGVTEPWCTYIPFISSYDEYRTFVESGKYSLGLAPIYCTEFYQSKYFNKFIEYTSAGILGMYTESEPYTQVVRHKSNGYFCQNTVESWYQGLYWAIQNRSSIPACQMQAAQQILQDFHIERVAETLVKSCPDLVSYKAPVMTKWEIKLPKLRILFYWERFRLLWQTKGILAILIIIKKLWLKLVTH